MPRTAWVHSNLRNYSIRAVEGSARLSRGSGVAGRIRAWYASGTIHVQTTWCGYSHTPFDVDTAVYLEHVPKIPRHPLTGERYVSPARIPSVRPGMFSNTTRLLHGFYEVFAVWAKFYIREDTWLTYVNT
ncbi:hypothetical protein E2C01_092554 [Portunus trituberculatus]|uniref:Uncharacterized protein n=1 Tax=Portunus trituberculatus TaxID=210409 RepID=A0A5B7JKJ7_PORTR|nr:hypothetical protein [Portunus trituberculatus]